MSKFSFDWDYIKTGSPYVTISSLTIAFNNLAIKQLGSPSKVMLGFDEENMVIGVRPVKDESQIEGKTYDFASKVSVDGWVRIGCREFIARLKDLSNISFEPARRFGTETDDDVLVIRITEENVRNAKK